MKGFWAPRLVSEEASQQGRHDSAGAQTQQAAPRSPLAAGAHRRRHRPLPFLIGSTGFGWPPCPSSLYLTGPVWLPRLPLGLEGIGSSATGSQTFSRSSLSSKFRYPLTAPRLQSPQQCWSLRDSSGQAPPRRPAPESIFAASFQVGRCARSSWQRPGGKLPGTLPMGGLVRRP